jgi:hypothetical protein
MSSFQGGEKVATEINFMVGGEAGQGVLSVPDRSAPAMTSMKAVS